jgi:SAM-dependent methyltransferase
MSEPHPVCPVCASAATRFLLRNSDFLFGTTDCEFTVYRCTACAACFQHPLPPADILRQAYPEAYWWIVDDSRPSLAARLEKVYRETVLRHHVRVARRHFPGPAPRVLDVGCGSGTFLDMLRRRTGVTGEGLESSAAAARRAREVYGLAIHTADLDTAEFPPGSYDLITMFHVLEHLPRPHETLRKIRGWLAAGGVLLIQVPNVSSWQSGWFGRRWTGIDLPRHLVNFSPVALRRTLADSGFTPGRISWFSLRDNAPAMASSLCPAWDPVAMNLRGRKGFAFLRKVLYFGLVLALQPLAVLEAAAGRGGTMFVAARPDDSGTK